MEKLNDIAEQAGIDTIDDFYGKALVMIEVLKSMSKKEANKFMGDTLMMLDDEIEAFELS